VNRKRVHEALRVIVYGEVNHVPQGKRDAALTAHEKSMVWRRGSGIRGFGIATREKKGRKTREVVLKVYVNRKKARGKLARPVPRSLDVPGVGKKIPTDVVAIGRLRPQKFVARLRPACPGLAISHESGTTGTLGCLVRGQDGTLYILSNMHVLAPPPAAKQHDPIVQPSHQHGGGAPDVIATLETWLPLVHTAQNFPNVADAALARVLDPQQVVAAVQQLGGPVGVSGEIEEDMPVQKVGCVSGLTQGIVLDAFYNAELPYGGRRAGFRDQVLCTRFTDDGDSGALVLNMTGEAIGLHFAGSDTVSVFTRLGAILQALKVDLVTSP
jgi:hypothetical protein